MSDDLENLSSIIYTTTAPGSNDLKRCVIIIDRLRAVTYTHGEHRQITKGTEMFIYSINEPIQIVKVDIYDVQRISNLI